MKIEFELNEAEVSAFEDFRSRKFKELYEEQKGGMNDRLLDHEKEQPYLGAIGGGITWVLTRTTLGSVVEVEILGERRNITDYSSW